MKDETSGQCVRGTSESSNRQNSSSSPSSSSNLSSLESDKGKNRTNKSKKETEQTKPMQNAAKKDKTGQNRDGEARESTAETANGKDTVKPIADIKVPDLSSFNRGNYESYDPLNISWKIALELAHVENDSFREDFIRNLLYPKCYRMSKRFEPNEKDYAAIADRAKAYMRLVYTSARNLHVSIRDEKNNERIFLYRDPDTREALACALIKLPEYASSIDVGIVHKLYTEILRLWYRFSEWYSYLGYDNADTSLMIAEFERAGNECKSTKTSERLHELQCLGSSQLRNSTYPVELAYYVRRVCVKERGQGQGLGKKLLDYSLASLRPYEMPTAFNGPAKVELFSSPVAVPFYQRYGLSLAAQWQSEKYDLLHCFFAGNLPD